MRGTIIHGLCRGKQSAWLSANRTVSGEPATPATKSQLVLRSETNITTALVPLYHVAARQYITSRNARYITNFKENQMRKRNISIPIRVTEKELSVIDKKAARARLTRTEYLITCALGKEITLIEDLKPILADLRRIGNNLNQLTRLANMGKIQGVNLGECRAALEQTYTAIHTLAKRRNDTWQHS